MKGICEHCQYCRVEDRENYEIPWCSNSKSPYYRYLTPLEKYINYDDTCEKWTLRNKKAPWWMRVFNKMMRRWK